MISRVYRKHQQIYKCAKKTTRSARTLWLTQLVYQNLSRRSTRHNLVQITFPFWRRKEIWRATDTRPLTYHKLINKALFAIASCYGCRNGDTPLNSKTYRFFACSLQLKNIKYDTDTTHKKGFFLGGGGAYSSIPAGQISASLGTTRFVNLKVECEQAHLIG